MPFFESVHNGENLSVRAVVLRHVCVNVCVRPEGGACWRQRGAYELCVADDVMGEFHIGGRMRTQTHTHIRMHTNTHSQMRTSFLYCFRQLCVTTTPQ